MTLAAGFKFEDPKAQGLSPILLLSDSRYSWDTKFGDREYYDKGKKLHALAKNIFAVIAGTVLEAERALDQFRKCLALSSSGSFEDLGIFLKSSFDSTITTWDDQTPYCLLGAISTKGDSKLFYAQPHVKKKSYKISELSQDVKKSYAVIGCLYLEPKLQEKIDTFPRSGLFRLEHFMCLPDDSFPSGYDRKDRAIREAKEISQHISMDFLEIVEDPKEVLVHPPLQSVLLLPSGPMQLNLYEIASSKQITKKTISASEVRRASDPSDKAIVELNIRYSI
ncbi:hypothetical protein ACFLXU_00785 [Chloroflexota bacterium]